MPSEDAMPVKMNAESKEEGEYKKTSGSRKVTKTTSANAKSQPKVAKVKKEEPEANDSPQPIKAANSASRSKEAKMKKEDNDDSDDDKPLSKRSSDTKLDKEPKKKKKAKEEEKKKSKPAAGQKKREKKVYDLPGQRRDPPEEKDPLRIFYETLYKQMPNSEMAQVWMMESGLLAEEVAKKVYEQKQKKGQQKVISPVKAITTVKSRSKSVTVKRKTPSSPMHSVKNEATDTTANQSMKRKVEARNSENDSDDNLVLSKVKRRKAA